MVREELTPRARLILQAVEQAADERRRGVAPVAVRVDGALLLALELGVAGHERGAVAERLRRDAGAPEPDRLLDAVFGPGTEPGARLRRAQRSG